MKEFDDVVFGIEDTGRINLKNDADIYEPKCRSLYSLARGRGRGGIRGRVRVRVRGRGVGLRLRVRVRLWACAMYDDDDPLGDYALASAPVPCRYGLNEVHGPVATKFG